MYGILCVSLVLVFAGDVSAQTYNDSETLKVVGIDFLYVEQPMVVTSFLLITAIFIIAYHHAGLIADYIPETCLLILIGVASAAIFKATGQLQNFQLTERQFMLFYLPPIVADAAYQLYGKAFNSNVGTILLYAIVGTLINFFFIGGCLYGMSAAGAMGGDVLTGIDAFLYASIIIAVDPVAVIAIFKAVGVNDQLYYMVFGESLFNDAVTIVVFNLMVSFTFATSITAHDIGIAVAAFFTDSIGAALLGFVVGLLSAFVTRFTKHMTVIQPITLYLFVYWTYLLCELFTWSGIIGLTACCITQTVLAFPYLSMTAYITLSTGAAVAGTIVESLVFVFMGAEMLTASHYWNGLFVLWVVLLCLIGRLISVFGLNLIANPCRKAKIPIKEQFIQWFAGLRGALAFALTTTISTRYTYRSLFLTTTLIFILFTVFVMGIGMRPMVKWLDIEMKEAGSSSQPSFIDTRENADEPDVLVKFFKDISKKVYPGKSSPKTLVIDAENTSVVELQGGAITPTKKAPDTESYKKVYPELKSPSQDPSHPTASGSTNDGAVFDEHI